MKCRAFSIVAPSIWKSLPSRIRLLPKSYTPLLYKLLKTDFFSPCLDWKRLWVDFFRGRNINFPHECMNEWMNVGLRAYCERDPLPKEFRKSVIFLMLHVISSMYSLLAQSCWIWRWICDICCWPWSFPCAISVQIMLISNRQASDIPSKPWKFYSQISQTHRVNKSIFSVNVYT